MEASKAPGMRTEPPRGTKRRRRPLADLTNSLASSQSSCASAITKPPASSSITPPVRTSRQKTKLSVLAADFIDIRNSENPSSAPLSPPPSGIGRNVNLERSVYSRRTAPALGKRKSTEKDIPHPFVSSAPRLNNPDFGSTENDNKGVQSSNPHSVLHRKQKQHKATSNDDTSMHCMPQDFINQQKKYFEEVDAFPLSVEEVSSDELE